ncbi:MAG: Mur ligase family protein [Patescibacteria group bacterium]
MDLFKLKKIYCIGIGGIGVSAVARWARHNDIAVSGSDIVASDLTRALEAEGIGVIIGHAPENVPDDADLAVYTPAVEKDHIERKAAKKKKIPQLSYPEFLGALSEKKFTIAVTGTHGKSTTTALIGLMLQEAGFDPTVFVGSLVPQLEHGNVRVGHSNFLVVEACEHQGNMRHIKPNIAVVTYIEPDHLDFYKDLKHEIKVYQEFVDELPKDGVLIRSAEDPGCQQLKWKGKTYTFGKTQEKITVGVPGEFNVRNVLAASIAASQVGVPEPVWRRVAAEFRGIWRRFEKVGEYKGATIYSDYGHHPTAIRETMKMVRELYPKRRVMLVYQPHQHNRTKNLFNEFVDALAVAPVDVLVLNEIYDVAGREEGRDHDVTSKKLADEIRRHCEESGKAGRRSNPVVIEYTATLDDAESWLRAHIKKDDVVVIMGAGDIDAVARKLIT